MKKRGYWGIITVVIVIGCWLNMNPIKTSAVETADGESSTEGIKDEIREEEPVNTMGTEIISGDFAFQIENGEAKVCSYLGTDAEIIIPNNVNGYKVTSISSDFSGRSCYNPGTIEVEERERVVSIVIPDTVELIEDAAFSCFCNLKNVQLSENLQSIGARVFQGTSIESITVPKSLIEVTHGCYGPFTGCTSLKEVKFENGTTQIADKLFRGCTSLATVTIPDTVMEIGSWAFAECTNLTSVYLPDSVTTIGSSCFRDCTNLSYIRLSSNLKPMASCVFRNVSKLEIEIDGKLPELFRNSEENPSLTEVTIKGNETEIDMCAFMNQYNLQKVTMSGVKIIDEGVFLNCSNLREVYISDDVKEIKTAAFENCSSLETISLPSGLKVINFSTFNNCTSLKTIRLPDNIEKVEAYAFSNCSNLKSIYFNKAIRTIDINACSNVKSIIVYGYKGTYAETYAKKIGYIFKPYSVKATKLTINRSTLSISVSEKMLLKTNITPIESTDTVSWTSSNKEVVTVSSRGEVSARGTGTAIVTARAGGVSATCRVTVVQPVRSIVNMRSTLTMQPGTTYKLTATVQPANASNKAVTWKSSNTKVATVSSTGKVTAKAAGTVTITCTAKDGSGKKATCKITVYNNTQAYVARIYTKALGRAAEPAGLNYWVGEINSKRRTPVQVAEEFFFAPEFTNKKLSNTEYVKVLYRTFMGREYDKGGLDYWVGRLNKGESRKSVLEAFAGCPEFQKIVKSFGL